MLVGCTPICSDGWLGECAVISRAAIEIWCMKHPAVSSGKWAFSFNGGYADGDVAITNQGRRCHLVPAGILIFRCRRKRGVRHRRALTGWCEQWLAGEFCEQLPQELDFNQLTPLPHQWVKQWFLPDGMVESHRDSRRRGCHHHGNDATCTVFISSLFQTLRLIKDIV